MSEGRGPRDDPQRAGRYDVRVKGHLDRRWASWFDGLRLTHEADGQTVIHGAVIDQAALHGLLQRVRDGGMTLVSVTRPEDEPDPHAGRDSAPGEHRTERTNEK